jgi:antitoxin (DNA-binding transcriptional repressor) of toxin-antitoxin stability system
VEKGETLLITREGKVVAELSSRGAGPEFDPVKAAEAVAANPGNRETNETHHHR